MRISAELAHMRSARRSTRMPYRLYTPSAILAKPGSYRYDFGDTPRVNDVVTQLFLRMAGVVPVPGGAGATGQGGTIGDGGDRCRVDPAARGWFCDRRRIPWQAVTSECRLGISRRWPLARWRLGAAGFETHGQAEGAGHPGRADPGHHPGAASVSRPVYIEERGSATASSGWKFATIRRIPSRQSTFVVPTSSCIRVKSTGSPRSACPLSWNAGTPPTNEPR
jgi:hypothetical protein